MAQPHVAVVGCGHWGKNLVRNIRALGALRTVVEAQGAAHAKVRELAPEAAVTARLEDALADPAVTAVMIATPAETHHALARQALEAGRDVFVEKPMTTRVPESRELVALAAGRERILMVGHLLEYHPAVRKIHELINSGELGTLYYIISNRVNLGKVRTEENALWSFAPHDIAVILRLVGEMPFEVVATGGSYVQPNIADVTVTQLLFDNGMRAHIFVSWLHPFKEQKLVVIGSKNMASYDDVTKELLVYDQRVEIHSGLPVPVKGQGKKVSFSADEPLRLECEHYLECVRTRRRPLTDGESGLRVLRILEGAERSLVTHGTPVHFPVES